MTRRKITRCGLVVLLLFAFACSRDKADHFVVKSISSMSDAVNPYLTKDDKGNAVLCWTEINPGDSLYSVKYAVYDEGTGTFGNPVTVGTSAGTGIAAESMNKIAFKADGTIIALFSRRFPNEKNPWAGAICYSMSEDHGKSWSPARYLHSDTAHTYSRSFFDIARLKDGELAAVWLDGRYGKADTGSALFFSRTSKGKGFGEDKCICRNTCECCRTELLSAEDGSLHVAFRSIQYPASLLDKQVRDMVYMTSGDNGATFSKPVPIGRDNWQIEGCPHTGPSLAVLDNKVHALWFTGAGNSGLYYASCPQGQGVFGRSVLVSAEGRHPQMIASGEDLAMVWEQESTKEHQHHTEPAHQHGMHHSAEEGGRSSIILRLVDSQGESKTMSLTSGKGRDHHAVIIPLKKKLLIAWVKEDGGHSSISYADSSI